MKEQVNAHDSHSFRKECSFKYPLRPKEWKRAAQKFLDGCSYINCGRKGSCKSELICFPKGMILVCEKVFVISILLKHFLMISNGQYLLNQWPEGENTLFLWIALNILYIRIYQWRAVWRNVAEIRGKQMLPVLPKSHVVIHSTPPKRLFILTEQKTWSQKYLRKPRFHFKLVKSLLTKLEHFCDLKDLSLIVWEGGFSMEATMHLGTLTYR